MDNYIKKSYREYGKEVNSNRAFPLAIDGLKPVERRLLYSTFQLAKDKLVKCARVDGNTMALYHPHSSSYGTLVQLVRQGFIEGHGNFGNTYAAEESPAAAMRYTECKMKKETNRMAFQLINHVPYSVSEIKDPSILEPDFIPTMFPFCLLGNYYTTGIGFGHRAIIPCYSISDLKERLLFLLGKKKEEKIIKPISSCIIKSTDDELKSLLTTGEGKILFKGVYRVDKIHHKIVIKSWPDGKVFKSILDSFSEELENQDIGWIDESSKGNGGTYIKFEVLKQRNKDVILQSIVDKLDNLLTGNVSFKIIGVDYKTKNVKVYSVDELLLNTYKMYTFINNQMLNSELDKYSKMIDENLLIKLIRPSLSKHLMSIDKDKIIENISKEVKVDVNLIKELFQKYKIQKLLNVDVDINELEETKKLIKYNIDNLDAFVLAQYDNILK